MPRKWDAVVEVLVSPWLCYCSSVTDAKRLPETDGRKFGSGGC